MGEALPRISSNKGGLVPYLASWGRLGFSPGEWGRLSSSPWPDQGSSGLAHVTTPQGRKLLAAAQQMLRDSQLKVALLRMKISSLEASGSPEPGEALRSGDGQGRAGPAVGLRADPSSQVLNCWRRS